MRTTWGVIRGAAAVLRLSDAGKLPSTAQLNEFQYETFFDALLQQGDVLHIAFGSGMTASVQNAMLAAETLREKYPERKLTVIDLLCSSSGYGLLVDGAANLRDEGRSMDEIADWVLEKRQKVHHQFYSTELKFTAAAGVCPALPQRSARCSASAPSCVWTTRAASLPATRSAARKTPSRAPSRR
ncbi:MAG: DegV family protein [Oscillospiraceae bacterium]